MSEDSEQAQEPAVEIMKSRVSGRMAITAILVSALIVTSGIMVYVYSQIEKDQAQEDFTFNENLKVLDNDASVTSVMVEDSSITATLSGSTEERYSVGDLIVGTEGMGYLRRITAIDQVDDSVVFTTENASLADAIQKGAISMRRNLTLDVAIQETAICMSSASNAAAFATDGFDVNMNRTFEKDGLEINITGWAHFEIEIILEAHLDLWSLEYLYFAAHTVTDFELGFQASHDILIEESVVVLKVALPEIWIWASWLPIIFTPVVEFIVGVNAESHAELDTSLEGTISTMSGLQFEHGSWSIVDDVNHYCQYNPPVVAGSCMAEVYTIMPRLKLMVYGICGPYVDLKPYLAFSSSMTASLEEVSLEWDLNLGLKGIAGVRIEVFDTTLADYSSEIFDLKWPIASGSLGPPGAPRNLQISPGDSSATLSWDEPLDTGGVSLTGYTIYRRQTGGSEAPLVSLPLQTEYADTSVANGITYYYRVSAHNDFGEGAKSLEVSVEPSGTATAPSVPQSLFAEALSQQVSLHWQAPSSDGGSPITGYRVYRGTVSGQEQLLVQLSTVLAYLDSGLTNGVTYYYRVSAVNVVDESALSDRVSATPTGSIAGNLVRIGWVGQVINWNPLRVEMVEDDVTCHLIYSFLFTYDEDLSGPVNDLATGYSQVVNPGGTMTTTIDITQNAYFRNKANPTDTTHKVTAHDVAFTLNLVKNNMGGAFDWYLQEVDNIIAVSEDRVSMDTPYSKATLIDDLAGIPIVPEYLWDGYSDPLATMSPYDLVGSGPFMFDSHIPGSWIKFTAAPNYHGELDYGDARTVGIDGIMFTSYPSVESLTAAVNNGIEDAVALYDEVDIYLDNLGMGSSSTVTRQSVPRLGICDVAINAILMEFRTLNYGNGSLLLLDPIVRKAIMMTLNKDFIMTDILRGVGVRADSVVPPGYWHKTIENRLSYDPAGAKAMLEANGWEDGDSNGLLEATTEAYGVQMGWFTAGSELSGIRCQAPGWTPAYGEIVYAWQSWAADAGIGLVPSIEAEQTMVSDAWYSADYDIWVWHWGWGPEPLERTLSVWRTSEICVGGDNCQMPMGPWWYMTDPYNRIGLSAFDENWTLARGTLDKSERKTIVDTLQQWIYDSYCENPPFYDFELWGSISSRFSGWGDWSLHPGRTPTSALPWLWFDLQPLTVSMAAAQELPRSAYVLDSGNEQGTEVLSDEGQSSAEVKSTPSGDTNEGTFSADIRAIHDWIVEGLARAGVLPAIVMYALLGPATVHRLSRLGQIRMKEARLLTQEDSRVWRPLNLLSSPQLAGKLTRTRTSRKESVIGPHSL